MTLEEKKERLIREEWTNFTAVHNEGGRAECQDDPQTFFIMRRSQFTCWGEELVDSWYADLVNARERGRNLLSEKYAWMMQSTAPQEFCRISQYLTFPTALSESMMDEIAKAEVAWMEKYEREYPYMAGGNRPVHSSQDSEYATSFETYLRGELHTYSEKTLKLYLEMIKELQKEGLSLAEIVMNAMVKQYGYQDLADAERQQKIRSGLKPETIRVVG